MRDSQIVSIYEESKRRAQWILRRAPGIHTLQPTCLLHSAFRRLLPTYRGTRLPRSQALALVTVAMTNALCDYLKRINALKRPPRSEQRDTSLSPVSTPDWQVSLASVREALSALRSIDPRCSDILKLRIESGLGSSSIATELGLSQRTVQRELAFGAAWIQSRLSSPNEKDL